MRRHEEREHVSRAPLHAPSSRPLLRVHAARSRRLQGQILFGLRIREQNSFVSPGSTIYPRFFCVHPDVLLSLSCRSRGRRFFFSSFVVGGFMFDIRLCSRRCWTFVRTFHVLTVTASRETLARFARCVHSIHISATFDLTYHLFRVTHMY